MSSEKRVEAYGALCKKLDAILVDVERGRLLSAGTSTDQIDARVASLIDQTRVTSSFYGYGGFPAHISASVNDELTNVPPSRRRLLDGDQLNLQIGIHDADAFCLQSWSYSIGRPRNPRLLQAALKALRKAVAAAHGGARVRDITTAIQATIEAAGYSTDRDYVGHAMDERQRRPPRIPCAVSPSMATDLDTPLQPGMILTIVVAAHEKGPVNVVAEDTWTVRSKDGGDAVMLSQIVVVRNGPPLVLLPERPISSREGRQ